MHNQLQQDLEDPPIMLNKHRKTESIIHNFSYVLDYSYALMMISGMSSMTSIHAPPVGIAFRIVSGVESAVNIVNVSILKIVINIPASLI